MPHSPPPILVWETQRQHALSLCCAVHSAPDEWDAVRWSKHLGPAHPELRPSRSPPSGVVHNAGDGAGIGPGRAGEWVWVAGAWEGATLLQENPTTGLQFDERRSNKGPHVECTQRHQNAQDRP